MVDVAPAPFQSSLSGHAESSTATAIFRNDDALSRALRNGTTLDIDDIARLNHTPLSAPEDVSSIGTSSTAVFSSLEESVVTKPTSAGTDHETYTRMGKGKAKLKTGYCSSLSGTHGSASEAEAERSFLRRNHLLAVGDWADTALESSQTLRGIARAKERQQPHRKPRHKKPTVVIVQSDRAGRHVDVVEQPTVPIVSSRRSPGKLRCV
jgi:hypothetical protein